MEGYLVCLIVSILFAGTLAHEETDEKHNSSGSFFLSRDDLNLSISTTTLIADNETTTIVLNETTTINLNDSTTVNSTATEERVTNITTELITEFATRNEQDYGDLTVTDSSGCYTNLKEKIEDACHHKFDETIVALHSVEEHRNQRACCALEDYEKCSRNGYKRANCKVDPKELKQMVATAKLFIAAMSEVNCAEHKAACNSASAFSFSFILAALPVLTLLL